MTFAASVCLSIALGTPTGSAAPEGNTHAEKRAATIAATHTHATSNVIPLQWRDRNAHTPRPSKISRATSSISPMRAIPETVRSTAKLPELAGAVVYGSNWNQQNAAPGLYTIPTSADEEFTAKFVNREYIARGGGVCANGSYFYVTYQEQSDQLFAYVFEYDTETWEQKRWLQASIDNIAASGMAVDPTSGLIYGYFYNTARNGYNFGTIDFSGEQAKTTVISAVKDDTEVAAIACDKDGQLYAITRTIEIGTSDYSVIKSELAKVDKATGNMTVIGETGMFPYYPTAATIDVRSGRMFWTVCPNDGSGNLCEVDLTTGKATLIYKFPNDEEVQGLYVPEPLAVDNAPAEVTGLSADFPDGSLSGKVLFTAPNRTFAGAAATGELSYTVTINGDKQLSGTTSCGAPVEVPVTVDESGDYTFSVRTSNAAGSSPATRISLFIGTGVPSTPQPSLTVENGVATVTWEPVNTVVDKGYINPDDVTYTVRRYPDATVVSENQKATSFTEPLPPTDGLVFYSYSVTATYSNATSAEGTTNSHMAGSCNMPYTQDFGSDSSIDTAPLDGYTIIDANKDGRQWDIYFGEARMAYNTLLAMDDWLITPPLHLEAGKSYPVKLDARTQDKDYNERIELKFGRTNTVEGMTGTVTGPTLLKSTTPVVLKGFIVAPETGDYYLGIHGISDADKYYLLIDNLSISEGVDVALPEAPALSYTVDAAGASKVTFRVTVPSTDVFGNKLSSVSKLVVLRNGKSVKTFENPTPGSQENFEDVTPTEGNYLYEATAYIDNQPGKTASVNVYVGIDVPDAPATTTIVEAATPGDVTLTWSEVTSDVHGTPIKPATVTYNVYRFVNGLPDKVKSGISGTTFTFTAVEEGQEFVQCAVRPVNDKGEGTPVITDMVIAGTPYQAPWAESFDYETVSTFAIDTPTGDAEWGLVDDGYFGIPSQDNDGYTMSMIGNRGDASTLITGKISLDGLAKPGMTLYAYTLSDEDTNTIEILAGEVGSQLKSIKTVALNQIGKAGWNMISADLAQFAGKTIQLGIKATIVNYDYIVIDNLRIRTLADCDMAAQSVAAPLKAKVGKEFQVEVSVLNDGIKTAESYTVKLLADGKELQSTQGEALQPGQATLVTFTPTLHPLTDEPVELQGMVEIAGDEVMTNNTTPVIIVKPVLSTLPPVTDLIGKRSENGVNLSWSEPDMDTPITAETTADFEDEISFTHFIEGWKFIDADKRPVGGFNKFDIPGIIPGSTLASFFVFDSTLPVFSSNFAAHSGNKFLGAMWRNDENKTNDWLILPELNGEAQTISFYARSFDADFFEQFTVYASATGNEIANFSMIDDVEKVPFEWTRYTFNVPAGTKYFALNSHSSNNYILMLDDFTFTPAPEHKEFSLTGYTVYRNEEALSTVEENEHFDNEAPENEARYAVTAVYDKGESKSSNVVVITSSGIDETEASRTFTVTAVNGTIVITGAKGCTTSVCAIDGKSLFAGTDSDTTTVHTGAGVFVVTINSHSTKIMVR